MHGVKCLANIKERGFYLHETSSVGMLLTCNFWVLVHSEASSILCWYSIDG